MRELAEVRLAEIDRIVQTFLKDRNALDGVSVAELRRRLKDGGVVVLDVRPEGEYRAGHIAGDRSVPLAELEARLQEIPKDQEVVAYCRGPYCVFADEAVALLRARGSAPGGSSWGSPTTRPEGYRWREAGSMRTIDAETLRRWLDKGLPVTVLDVRQGDDRAEWSIPGSIHVDAYRALKSGDPAALAGIELSADAPVVTVCGMGHASRVAAEQLQARGYRRCRWRAG